jgi:hypothetical protein
MKTQAEYLDTRNHCPKCDSIVLDHNIPELDAGKV